MSGWVALGARVAPQFQKNQPQSPVVSAPGFRDIAGVSAAKGQLSAHGSALRVHPRQWGLLTRL